MAPVGALSIDLEYFSDLPAYPDRAEDVDRTVGQTGLEWLAETLDTHGVRSTFFVVSRIAEDSPETVAALARDDHEIASHTHTHRHLSELDPADRRREVVESKQALEAVTGDTVAGFRAPSFDRAPGHFRLLSEAGYAYDSSVAPARSIPGWYGGTETRRRPYTVETDAGDLVEVPVAVMPGLKLPLTGTWLRFFGVRYALAGMRALARQDTSPVLYVHPWELIDLPRLDGVPRRVYWRTGSYMRRAIRRLLQSEFEFVTVGELARTPTAGCDRDPADHVDRDTEQE